MNVEHAADTFDSSRHKDLEPEMHNKVKKGSRLTGERREILLAVLIYKYLERNMSIRALVADTGRSYGTVHLMLSDAGVLRSKGGKPRQ